MWLYVCARFCFRLLLSQLLFCLVLGCLNVSAVTLHVGLNVINSIGPPFFPCERVRVKHVFLLFIIAYFDLLIDVTLG